MGINFGDLCAHIEKDGVRVERAMKIGKNPPVAVYEPPLTRDDKVLAAARIRVFNNDVTGKAAPREPTDTITLAHEYGHHLRYACGERKPEYTSFVRVHGDWSKWPQCAMDDRRRVLEEEEGAWVHAAAVLKQLGFADWPAFDADRDASITDYRRKLALVEG
jgi:hypothetical protein